MEKISTIEILEKLKIANGDYTSFFYLFVSTGGVEQKRRHLPVGQQTLDNYICRGSDSDDTESDDTESEESNDESMETDHDTTTFQSKILVENNPSLLESRKAKMRAMKRFHKSILPGVLYPHGWKKVYDKNTKLVYRALFFNVIEKLPNEDDISHIWRVSKVKEVISEEATKLEQQYDVNFAVTSLISKPIVYDQQALEVVSMREGSTQRQPQLYKYFK